MITREQMENYLRKGGYHATENTCDWVVSWQYKESDMYCVVGESGAIFYETGEPLKITRDIVYKEWSIDPGCGCLKKVET